MKVFVLAFAFMTSGIGISQVISYNYTVQGCNDSICELMDEGTLSSLANQDQWLLGKGKTGTGRTGLKSALSTATGVTYNAISGFVDGLRTGAVALGYDSFQAGLSGPGGSITFTMNLKTGKWNLSGGGDENGGPVKIEDPNPGVE